MDRQHCPQPTPLDHLSRASFSLGVVILSGSLGMLCAAFDLPPYRLTKNAIAAMESLQRQWELAGEETPGVLWSETTNPQRGVVLHRAEQTHAGLTLYGTAGESAMVLVDLAGKEVHRWSGPFEEIWAGASNLNMTIPERFVYMRRGHVFANGDLLALYETPLRTPNGIGLAKLNRDGELIWRFEKNAHHDLDVAEDGTIYVLTHEILTESHPDMRFLQAPVIDDRLSILNPDGSEQKTFSLLASFGRSPYCRQPTIEVEAFGDSFHSNTVNIVSDAFAAHYDEITPGDVMVCARDLNLVFVVNPESERTVWATTGPWHHPHDPDPLPNGNILIFDNYFARGAFTGSRVVEFDPRTGKLVWEFAGDKDNEFRSDVRGCQQRLANGNVLITESDNGRLREVTPAGEIVWEFTNPIRGGTEKNKIPILVGAERIPVERLQFLTGSAQAQEHPE